MASPRNSSARRHAYERAAQYSVIVDRISHEVEYYRGYLKHAVLQGTYVINNPFWWTADDKFFNYSVAAKTWHRHSKTILLPQKGYPADVDITSESLHNLTYPMDWDGLLDYVGRPAILNLSPAAAGNTSTKSTTRKNSSPPTTKPRPTA